MMSINSQASVETRSQIQIDLDVLSEYIYDRPNSIEPIELNDLYKQGFKDGLNNNPLSEKWCDSLQYRLGWGCGVTQQNYEQVIRDRENRIKKEFGECPF